MNEQLNGWWMSEHTCVSTRDGWQPNVHYRLFEFFNMIEVGSLYVYTWFRKVLLTWSSCNMVLLLIHAFERTHTLNATANPFKLYALVKSFFLSCSGKKITGGDGSRPVPRISAHSLWRREPTMTGHLYRHICDWPKLYDQYLTQRLEMYSGYCNR